MVLWKFIDHNQNNRTAIFTETNDLFEFVRDYGLDMYETIHRFPEEGSYGDFETERIFGTEINPSYKNWKNEEYPIDTRDLK